MRTKTSLLTTAACLLALPALAHEGGGDGEHLNVGFYYGHDGTFEAPADPAQPATLLVDTHPWELDTVFYQMTFSDEAPYNGWSTEFPGFRSLLVEDEEDGGHGYYSWLDTSHGVATPDLRLHLVSKDENLTIIDPGTTQALTTPHVIGTDTANHHLIYYVDQSTGVAIDDVLTATFYLTDANGGLAQSENFTVQFRVMSTLPGDTDNDGDVDDADLGTAFANYTGPLDEGVGTRTVADGDTDGDGDIDDADLGSAFAAYTGPLAPTNVPEPASAILLALGGLALTRRR
jgi:hypothetical protein